MTFSVIRRSLTALIFAVAIPFSALADSSEGTYLDSQDAQAFIEEMASEHGFERQQIEGCLGHATRQDKIIESISRPAEKTLEWHQYRNIFIKPEQIEDGLRFMAEHESVFARAESTFGVSRYIIAGVLGVETRFGRYLGNYRVLDALATLAFDYPPRSRFFRKELGEFFLMTREQGFDPLTVKGSYAGAMGFGQFISSSYRHYAVDFDDDQVADILTNPVDAIGSIANYFARHGWKEGQPVADRLDKESLPDDSLLLTKGLKPSKTVADYRKAGVDVAPALKGSAPARALSLEGADGPELWLTYHNFYVITRYNHSHLYGMAVNTLAQEIQAADETRQN
ncbi:lytic murein transglycosylase B [Marinobacter salicampi]|uniref:lytic murein transglycosylase B n=1 Tax=Marinobacter salicampi TaxID=435907 RepID=UPI00140BF7DD|nr:lytic murein transglycosylase B [Marinobacter salicampi]